MTPAAVRAKLGAAHCGSTRSGRARAIPTRRRCCPGAIAVVLTGFLVPYEAPAEQREDEQGQEQLDLPGRGGRRTMTRRRSRRRRGGRSFLRRSGVSVLTPGSGAHDDGRRGVGDYRYLPAREEGRRAGRMRRRRATTGRRIGGSREQRRAEVVLAIGETGKPDADRGPGQRRAAALHVGSGGDGGRWAVRTGFRRGRGRCRCSWSTTGSRRRLR